MPIDTNDIREALQPQDGLAAVITVLGIAIAIFLPDSVVKLIGACIALLGGLALYMTLRARINDKVQIRQKRTTLPPPAFKTNVSTDPKTSATRIRFDDFQESFSIEDEAASDESEVGTPQPAREAPTRADSDGGAQTLRFDDVGSESFDNVQPLGSRTPPRSTSMSRAEDPVDDDSSPVEEGFRIIPSDSSSRPKESAEATSAPELEPETHERHDDLRGRNRSKSPNVEVKREKSARKKERGGKKRTSEQPRSQPDESPHVAQQASGDVGTFRPDSVSREAVASVKPGEVAGDGSAVRRQIRLVLDELSPDDDGTEENEPRSEFVRLVNQVLKGLARSIDGRSILFFWVNNEKGHFIPEACVTRDESGVALGERLKLGNDLVSQIAHGGVPEIITDISPAAERELLPYYRRPISARSFVGVPVYYRHEVVGVLAADSVEENGFDEGSVATLAEYTLLISQLIRAYAEKFDLFLMRQSIEAFERLHSSLAGTSMPPNEIAQLLAHQVSDTFDASYVAVILFDKKESEWSVAACQARDPNVGSALIQLTPDMRQSLAGDAARNAGDVYVANVNGEMRIAPEESLPAGGSFLAVPLMASAKCYGSLVLGHHSSDAWVSRDIDLVRDLARYAAMAIEVVNTNEALEEQLVFDEETGVYNTAFFMTGFDREIDRARDFKTPLSLVLVSVETPDSFEPERRGELSHLSVTEVGTLLAKKLRPYDLLGRFDHETFCVALVGRSDQEAYLWAERLRKEIAGHIIPFQSRTFSVTVSAGVSNATDSSDKSQVINGARQALEKAIKDGGNSVVIY